MSEDSRSTKLRKRYYVVNPGSGDSDDAKDDYRHYSRPQQHRPSPSQPNLLTTDLAGPPLSPDSTPSPSTPPPPTHAPSSSLDHPKPLPVPDPDPVPPATSRKGKFLQTLKAPFGSRPLRSAAPDPNSPRRPRTVSLPISPLFFFLSHNHPKSPQPQQPRIHTPLLPLLLKSSSLSRPIQSAMLPLMSVVQEPPIKYESSSSQRSVSYYFSTHSSLILPPKLHIYDDDENHPYSIYKTEIGAYAMGEALTSDRLLALCRDHGDSKGTLKFFVSHSSAPVHEPSTPIPPVEYNPIPLFSLTWSASTL
jgi:hypothetical protein